VDISSRPQSIDIGLKAAIMLPIIINNDFSKVQEKKITEPAFPIAVCTDRRIN